MKNNNIITKIDEDKFKYKLDSIDDLIEVIDYVRPTAKDMFEMLGYELKIKQKDCLFYEKGNQLIEFNNYGDAYVSVSHIITLDELTAINKQIEELGW